MKNNSIQSPERLAVLHETGLLGADAEVSLDRLTTMAATLLNVPVSLISFVAADHQYFVSRFGLNGVHANTCQTPLSGSICQYVVTDNQPLLVRDTRVDERLKDNDSISALNVVAYAGVPLRTQDGHVLGSLCVIDSQPHDWKDSDLAVLEQLADAAMQEIELRRRLRKAEAERDQHRANEIDSRDELFATLGHELRNNIGPAVLAADMLAMDDRLPDDCRADVAAIKRALTAESFLINDMVDAARVIRGRLRLECEQVDLTKLVRETLEDLRHSIDASKVAFDWSVPKSSPDTQAWVDSRRLRQVLVNLVGNASKFTDRGSIHIALQTEDDIVLCVTDTGSGMAPAEINRLFDPMPKASDGRSNRRAGLGLGLTICRGIVQAHGGTIVADSDGPGHGSRFTVTLPRNPRRLTEPARR